MKTIAIVFFEATAYDYEEKILNEEAKKNPSMILTNGASAGLRREKRTLKPEFKKVLNVIADSLVELTPNYSVKVSYSKKAGCNMCPCSPGYVLKAEQKFGQKIGYWIDENAQISSIQKYD